ncbi:hypothetical protein AGMMS50230_20370 [Spirochaetia bacterium]|nr:hypothetical protein AGMMS50230_20370 [Spirochaetia bacterium]
MSHKYFLLLHSAFFIYSLGSIFSKLASNQALFSFSFLVFYSLSIIILFIYAILWQQILKRIPLVIAVSNKGIVVAWGFLWGILFFQEKIKINMIIGLIFILSGIFIFIQIDHGKGNI